MKKIHDSETLARGQQVITACAFIYHDFGGVIKVFLPKRANTKKFLPGVYELPGGHIDYGEDIEDGLRREIKEEFNNPNIINDETNNINETNNDKIVDFLKQKFWNIYKCKSRISFQSLLFLLKKAKYFHYIRGYLNYCIEYL